MVMKKSSFARAGTRAVCPYTTIPSHALDNKFDTVYLSLACEVHARYCIRGFRVKGSGCMRTARETLRPRIKRVEFRRTILHAGHCARGFRSHGYLVFDWEVEQEVQQLSYVTGDSNAQETRGSKTAYFLATLQITAAQCTFAAAIRLSEIASSTEMQRRCGGELA